MKKDDTGQYSNSLEFEHELINRRLTWLLTSQTILFAAYGLAIRAGNPAMENSVKVFLEVTPRAGIAISGLIFVGILCGVFAKWYKWQDSEKKKFGAQTWVTFLALLPDLMLPVVFACAWTWIGVDKPEVLFWRVLVIGASITVLTLLILCIIGVAKKKGKGDKKNGKDDKKNGKGHRKKRKGHKKKRWWQVH